MSSLNILFYSNHCEGSKQLLASLQGEKLLRFFHLVCTDNNQSVPPQIKVTPTLIIRGVPTPYVASDAFVWFAKVKQWKVQRMMQQMNQSQQQYLQSVNNNLSDNNLNVLGFNQAEMNGMSDIFSFFSKNIGQECQDPLPQSYFSCSDLGRENIFTPPLEDGGYKIVPGGKYKINASKQKELRESMESQRKKQDDTFKRDMDNFKKQHSTIT